MTLHDRIARARAIFAGPWNPSLIDRRPAAPDTSAAPSPSADTLVSHHPGHLDRRTNLSTRPVANHHPHRKD